MPVASLNFCRRRIVAGIARRDLVARPFSALLIASPMPRVPPVTSATRAMTSPPVGFLVRAEQYGRLLTRSISP